MYSLPGLAYGGERPPMEYPPYTCFNYPAYKDRGCEGCKHNPWAKCPRNGWDAKRRKALEKPKKTDTQAKGITGPAATES